jgi:PAT family beta-lactamase induction signal transducer AmpG
MNLTIIKIFFLGFASGLPFLLILSTLSLWLIESGISKGVVGVFAWITLPYTLKFILAPMIDSTSIPVLTKILGRRRSWLLASQIGLMLFIILLGHCNPSTQIIKMAVLACIVGVFSAIQDLTIEAYRIENSSKKSSGFGISSLVLGYRIGMLCSGAGTLFIAHWSNDWSLAYSLIAVLMLVGVVTTITCKEPIFFDEEIKKLTTRFSWHKCLIWPFKRFKDDQQYILITLFILSYKFADTILNMMGMPFLLEIGFSKIEIASVAKTFGIGSMIVGSLIGGLLIAKMRMRSVLQLSIILQIVSCLLFMVQANVGSDLRWLFVTMGIENFACGVNQIALISYLSNLCFKPNIALHYAFLSSIASLSRIIISSAAGVVAENMPWNTYYLWVAILCIPALVFTLVCKKHFQS